MRIDQQCRGMRIIVGEEARRRRELLNALISIAENHGFQEITLPSVEPSRIYELKAGEEVLNQMYTFKDKKGRDVCLRPEVTATMQLIGEEHYKRYNDVKFWYFEKCWRYEKPQKGRYREFWQFGMEVLNPHEALESTWRDQLIALAELMVDCCTDDYVTDRTVSRGLDYYIEDGFEIRVPGLGAQEQVVGGGTYEGGIGFALGFDRLMLTESLEDEST